MAAPLVADSQLIWAVALLVLAAFAALGIIPFVIGRRFGFRGALAVALLWGLGGFAGAAALPEFGVTDALLIGVVVFVLPWLAAGALGARGRSADPTRGPSAESG